MAMKGVWAIIGKFMKVSLPSGRCKESPLFEVRPESRLPSGRLPEYSPPPRPHQEVWEVIGRTKNIPSLKDFLAREDRMKNWEITLKWPHKFHSTAQKGHTYYPKVLEVIRWTKNITPLKDFLTRITGMKNWTLKWLIHSTLLLKSYLGSEQLLEG